MIERSHAAATAFAAGQKPQPLLVITTQGGQYVLSDRPVGDEVLSYRGPLLADGSALADGSEPGGPFSHLDVISSGALVEKWGRLIETLGNGAPEAAKEKTVGLFSVSVRSEGLPAHSLIGARAELLLAIPGAESREYPVRFRGDVGKVLGTKAGLQITITAAGAGLTDTLAENLSLKKAGAYADPKNGNDVLPLVFGDMTKGGEGGQWNAVCVDTENLIYALAGHRVLSAAAGNTASVWDKDGNEITGWTFNHAHDLEGNGEIATISFARVSASDVTVSQAACTFASPSGAFAGIGEGWIKTEGFTESANNTQLFVVEASATLLKVSTDRDLADEAAGAAVTISADQSPGAPLAVVCKGLADVAGALIENPVEVARELLTGPGGLEDEDLDGPTWAETAKFCESLGYRAGRAFAKTARSGDALTNLLGDFFLDWWLAGDGRIKLAPAAGQGRVDETRLAGNLPAKVLDDPDAQYTEDEQHVCNQASVRYALNLLETGDDAWQAEDDGESTREPASRARHGARTRAFDLESVREAPVASAIQAAAVERWGWPLPRFVQNHDGPEALVWEAGDYITASIPWQLGEDGLPKINQIMRIAAVSPDLARGLVRLTLEDTGIFKTNAAFADGSYLAGGAVKAGSARDTREY